MGTSATHIANGYKFTIWANCKNERFGTVNPSIFGNNSGFIEIDPGDFHKFHTKFRIPFVNPDPVFISIFYKEENGAFKQICNDFTVESNRSVLVSTDKKVRRVRMGEIWIDESGVDHTLRMATEDSNGTKGTTAEHRKVESITLVSNNTLVSMAAEGSNETKGTATEHGEDESITVGKIDQRIPTVVDKLFRNKFYKLLCNEMKLKAILIRFKADMLFSRAEMDDVVKHPKDSVEQNEAFLDTLLKKDTKTMGIFFHEMKDSNQGVLLDRNVLEEIIAKIREMN